MALLHGFEPCFAKDRVKKTALGAPDQAPPENQFFGPEKSVMETACFAYVPLKFPGFRAESPFRLEIHYSHVQRRRTETHIFPSETGLGGTSA